MSAGGQREGDGEGDESEFDQQHPAIAGVEERGQVRDEVDGGEGAGGDHDEEQAEGDPAVSGEQRPHRERAVPHTGGDADDVQERTHPDRRRGQVDRSDESTPVGRRRGQVATPRLRTDHRHHRNDDEAAGAAQGRQPDGDGETEGLDEGDPAGHGVCQPGQRQSP